MHILSYNRHIQFSMMHKVSNVLAEDLFKTHWKLTFVSNILLELKKIKYPSMNLVMPTLFETKKYTSQ